MKIIFLIFLVPFSVVDPGRVAIYLFSPRSRLTTHLRATTLITYFLHHQASLALSARPWLDLLKFPV